MKSLGNSVGSGTRFAALDGMRGWFAMIVALAHLRVAGHYYDLDMAEHAYTIVDLFFVLSGFVIAHVTRRGLTEPRNITGFLLRRLGRVWPAHLFVLGLYIALELVKWRAELASGLPSGRHAFAPDTQFDAATIPANVFLIQSLGFFDRSTWNVPSWSISTELYTYLLFTLSTLLLPRRLVAVGVLATVASMVFIFFHAPNLNVTFDYGFPRTIAGFWGGFITYQLFRALPPLPKRWATLAEIVASLYLFLFFCFAGQSQFSILAPVLYIAPIWVFAFDSGAISKFLMTGPLQALGRWSYSIYLVHEFVYLVLSRGLTVLSRKYDLTLFTERGLWFDGTPVQVISIGGPWAMDALAVVMLTIVVLMSAGMNRWIEIPFQRPFTKLAKRLETPRVPRPDPAIAPATTQQLPANELETPEPLSQA